jgi:cytochrome c5
MKRLILFTIAIAFASLSAHADTQSFFKQHCVKCHGPDKQKAKLRLDTLAWKPSDNDNIELWQEIIDRVDSGEMPPKGEPKPSQESRTAILSLLQKRVVDAASSNKPKQVLLRRLNRAQYRNTIRDLLHIDVTVNDPTEAFPADDKKEGFDNLGEALQMSDFLLRQYLKVARRVVDQATFPQEKPAPATYRLKQEGKTRPKNFSVQANDKDRDYVVLTRNDERAPGDPRGQSLMNSRDGATHDCFYDFTFEVESKGRGNLAKEFSA